MQTTHLRHLLSASLDCEVQTPLLRLAGGLVDEIERKLAVPGKFGPRTEAFVSWEQVFDLTGVDHRTAVKHLQASPTVGLVSYEESGSQRMIDGRHTASSWTVVAPAYAPADLALTASESRALCAFFDPARACWTRSRSGSAGYRAMMAIVATYGLQDALLTGPQMAELLGIDRSNGLDALRAAAEAVGYWNRVGRKFVIHTDFVTNPMFPAWDRDDLAVESNRDQHVEDWHAQREMHLYGERLADRQARRDLSAQIMGDYLDSLDGAEQGPLGSVDEAPRTQSEVPRYADSDLLRRLAGPANRAHTPRVEPRPSQV